MEGPVYLTAVDNAQNTPYTRGMPALPLDALLADVRYAARSMARYPLACLVAVVSLEVLQVNHS